LPANPLWSESHGFLSAPRKPNLFEKDLHRFFSRDTIQCIHALDGIDLTVGARSGVVEGFEEGGFIALGNGCALG
jgi:hypothetical protein